MVKVQNQATLDGSPVALAIIKFMEDKSEYTATSSQMHSKLKVVAAQLGVDIERDKAWPKSARWLWRRIKEVLSLLVAAGIEAARSEEKRGTVITLRKMPTDDATDATRKEGPTSKANADGNTDADDATANATTPTDATANATGNPADRAESGNSGNRDGDSAEESISPEQAERIRRLIKQGMSETWARRTVLAGDYPLECECEVCL